MENNQYLERLQNTPQLPGFIPAKVKFFFFVFLFVGWSLPISILGLSRKCLGMIDTNYKLPPYHPQSAPVQPRGSKDRATEDLIQRSWV